MGIELPPELADVAARAGVAWPEADEEAMAGSARAWRDAAARMTALATDADTTARGALTAVEGETGEAAARHWQAFVEPDSGHLTSTVRGMNAAADRLEQAANQVGTAKVEIVRNLVALAENTDAAHAAAAAGHPLALAGLDTAVRGTSVNVANIESQLVEAVRPGTTVDIAALAPLVDATPGSRDAVATLAGPLPDAVRDAVPAVAGATVAGAHAVAVPVTDGVAAAGPPGVAPAVADTGIPDLARHVADSGIPDLAPHVADSGIPDQARNVVDSVTGTVDHVRHVADTVTPDHARHVVDAVGNGPAAATGDSEHTGPIRVFPDPAAVPGDPRHLGLPVDVVPGDPRPGTGAPLTDDLPTPPTGTTVRAGFDGGPAVAPGTLPPAAPPVGGLPAAGPPNAPAFAPQPGAPAVPGVPPPVGTAAPVAGAAGRSPIRPDVGDPARANPPAARPGPPGIPAPSRPVSAPADQPVSRPSPLAAGHPGTGKPAAALAGTGTPPPATALPVPARPAPDHPAPGQQAPARPAPAPQVPAQPGPGHQPPGQPMAGQQPPGHPGAAQPGAGQPGAKAEQATGQPDPSQPVYRERDEALALFWVHMFPIGHMPVAADRPGRQVAAPPEEFDYAAGLRFEPGDHPDADLVDGADRLARLRGGAPRVDPSEPRGRDDITALTEGHDPLGGIHERDWDRRYQVRFGRVTAEGIRPEGLEFAWPPGEQYPEGGSAPGEAEILDPGTEIDRFGTAAGRVFAAAGTPFAQRSLPPAHLDHGYRRYRVLRPLPVRRAVSAAWFAQPGGGVRYRTTHAALELEALGYLADITREDA